MNDWLHTLFSAGDLSDYLVERWQEFAKEMEAANFDTSLSKYFIRLPSLDLDRMTISKWGEAVPKPTDFLSYGDFLDARIARLEAMLKHQRQTFIVVDIPFDGDGDMFRYRPSGCKLPVPQGLLGDNSVKMRFQRCGSKDETWKTLFASDMTTVDDFIQSATVSVLGYNQKVRKSRPTV